jgi:hypothetical protein
MKKLSSELLYFCRISEASFKETQQGFSMEFSIFLSMQPRRFAKLLCVVEASDSRCLPLARCTSGQHRDLELMRTTAVEGHRATGKKKGGEGRKGQECKKSYAKIIWTKVAHSEKIFFRSSSTYFESHSMA